MKRVSKQKFIRATKICPKLPAATWPVQKYRC
uniref:Uncharacterized protein n=1 Tax=Romanomermis culicivorax TaxID=13658 RepID=A0A915HY11_ROMCU